MGHKLQTRAKDHNYYDTNQALQIRSAGMELNQSYFVNKGEFNIKQDGFFG